MKRRFLFVFMIIIVMSFSSSCSQNNEPENDVITRDFYHKESMTVEQILQIEDAGDFVIALCDRVGEKCGYGENMSVLTDPERIFYITQIVEMEVNNSSFAQFYFNSSGDFANEIVAAFETIGAVNTAEICRRANSIYGDFVPVDREERYDILLSLEDAADTDILSECDDAFFDDETMRYPLIRDYVIENSDAFT